MFWLFLLFIFFISFTFFMGSCFSTAREEIEAEMDAYRQQELEANEVYYEEDTGNFGLKGFNSVDVYVDEEDNYDYKFTLGSHAEDEEEEAPMPQYVVGFNPESDFEYDDGLEECSDGLEAPTYELPLSKTSKSAPKKPASGKPAKVVSLMDYRASKA